MTEDLAIRQTVRAVIRRGPLVLVQVKRRANGQRDLPLPGGRLETGETMQACLARECLAEIDIVPQVGDICHVADVIRTRRACARRSILAGSRASCPDLSPSSETALAPTRRRHTNPRRAQQRRSF
ncbi:NUDIX domain-containing protein [Tropicibacter alexandrii]|uniref:NUDIX domain-containing protein n=1 Tax=Tropicibacter alexandrii TaxID=2267683 RepID=UPI000EF53A08|nr:NUDIX domain-containing protein [Tropicibacter alexandrii]